MKSPNDISQSPDSFKYNIQVLDRALKLFETIALSDSPLTIPQLQELTGLNRTTIWRIISTMTENNFITQLPNSKQYCLSCKATNLLSLSHSRSIVLCECARTEMEQLRQLTGETIMLLIPENIGSRTILQLDSFENVRIKDYTNELSPLFGTSTGIVQLSFLSDEEIKVIFPAELISYTQSTATNKEVIMQRINDCRQDGYTYIIDEYHNGDSGLSVPLQLNRKLVGILNIAGPTVRFTKKHMLAYLPEIKNSAARIVQNLSQ